MAANMITGPDNILVPFIMVLDHRVGASSHFQDSRNIFNPSE